MAHLHSVYQYKYSFISVYFPLKRKKVTFLLSELEHGAPSDKSDGAIVLYILRKESRSFVQIIRAYYALQLLVFLYSS